MRVVQIRPTCGGSGRVLRCSQWCHIEQITSHDLGVAVIVPSAHAFNLKAAKHLARVAGPSPARTGRSVIDLPVLELQPAHMPVGPQIGQVECVPFVVGHDAERALRGDA